MPCVNSTTQRRAVGSKRQLPSGRWQVRVSCGYTRDGRQRRVTRTVDTEREAELEIARLAVEMGRGANMGDGMTLDEYFHIYFLPAKEREVTRATVNFYRSKYEVHIAPVLGRREMGGIAHAEIQRLVSSLPRPTAKHVAATLRCVLRSAWDDGLLDEEPMRHRLKFPPDEGGQLGVWTAGEVRAAMGALEGTPLEALWLAMTGGGLRREEALALFWRDLTFDAADGIDGTQRTVCRALVDDAVTVDDGRKPVKTRYSERIAVIAEPFASRLAEISGAPDDAICAIRADGIWRAWRSLWREPCACPASPRGRMLEAGVPYLPISRMRATHETLMQAAGVADSLNNRLHGRASNSQIGYRHYLNPADETLAEAAGALEDDLVVKTPSGP